MTQYYFIDWFGPEQKAATCGMWWLVEKASRASEKTGFVFVPSTEDFGDKTFGVAVSKLYGERYVKELMLNKETTIGKTRIILFDEESMITDAGDCPLVAFYPFSEELEGLDSIKNVSDMLVVPYIEKEFVAWKQRRNPIVFAVPQEFA
ncbi:MAG: hypothetical protein JRN52_13405 [Nitrososphaerota archaeon]|nr:hypothetical protein [Nitrososphaerota archaeon]